MTLVPEHGVQKRARVCAAHGGGLQLLMKVLNVVAGVLQRDALQKGEGFNGRPYYRIFMGLITELSPSTPASQEELPAMKMLAAIAVTLELLQPVRVPPFAFCWLELISHRCAHCIDFACYPPGSDRHIMTRLFACSTCCAIGCIRPACKRRMHESHRETYRFPSVVPSLFDCSLWC
jgi:hypothetical protein